MKIRMLHQRTGGRYDGQPWPPAGGTFEVPDKEAAALIEDGIAERVADEKPAPRAKAAKPATG